MSHINVDKFGAFLRDRSLNISDKSVRLARIAGSKQSLDLGKNTNCNGYGRLRNFIINRHEDWSLDPLPNLPAQKYLKLPFSNTLEAQVFQLASCNYRCWYCFVDDDRLSASEIHSKLIPIKEIIDTYLGEKDHPKVIDLSGGQPDLVPEWTLWTMEELDRRGLVASYFLWTDDNLSSFNLWDFLSKKNIHYMAEYPGFSRVGCFKGFDEASFSYNTKAPPEVFDNQFLIFDKLHKTGFDIYAYTTFTCLTTEDIAAKMRLFVDKLQKIHVNLPLRTVPLKIEIFSPLRNRANFNSHDTSMNNQHVALQAWNEEIDKRFSSNEKNQPISDVEI